MSKRSQAAQPTSSSAGHERREDFRLLATMGVRLRPITPETTDLGASDLVADFEELTYAAQNFRQELSGAGRQFVDQLVNTVETLVGKVQRPRAIAGWSDPAVLDVNLSTGGCGIRWNEALEEGSQVEIELAPGGEAQVVPFHTEASIVRCKEVGVGVFNVGLRFDKMSSTKEQRLKNLIYALQRLKLRQDSGTA